MLDYGVVSVFHFKWTGIMACSASMSVNPSESNSEWLTRKRLIDPKLKAAGWKIVPFSPEKPLSAQNGCAIEEFETANGTGNPGSPFSQALKMTCSVG